MAFTFVKAWDDVLLPTEPSKNVLHREGECILASYKTPRPHAVQLLWVMSALPCPPTEFSVEVVSISQAHALSLNKELLVLSP